MNRPPLAIAFVAILYFAAGAIGFVYHSLELLTFNGEALWIEAVRLSAVVAGVFLWLGHNWARWLAIAWITFHIVVGAFHGWAQFATHVLFGAIIAWALTRPAARAWVSRKEADAADLHTLD